jgi:hypothetical protein
MTALAVLLPVVFVLVLVALVLSWRTKVFHTQVSVNNKSLQDMMTKGLGRFPIWSVKIFENIFRGPYSGSPLPHRNL